MSLRDSMGPDYTVVKSGGQYRASSVWIDLLADGHHDFSVGRLCFYLEDQSTVGSFVSALLSDHCVYRYLGAEQLQLHGHP